MTTISERNTATRLRSGSASRSWAGRPLRGLAVAALCLFGCAGDAQDRAAERTGRTAGDVPATADSARYTLDDFQALRYLEGDWRGSGYEGGPFFESYRFADDSTIEMVGWTDSTMSVAREESQYMLRDGVVRTDEGARLVGVDDEGHHFRAESYGWTFRQVSPDQWTARVGPSTVYTMDRVGAH